MGKENKHNPDADPGTLASVEARLAEGIRRLEGDFDDLLGEYPDEKSIALRDVTYGLRDYLLDRYPEDTVRRMLVAQYPDEQERGGLQWGPGCTEADDLALELLGLIGSAFKSDAYHVLLSGEGGLKKARKNRWKDHKPTKLQARILDHAKKDEGPKRGLAARVHKNIINDCHKNWRLDSSSYENVRKTLRKFHNDHL
jgi:hypothetical protein